MSMNLQCNKFEMIQTPTYITFMCTVDGGGGRNFKLEGQPAIAALYRYREWVYESLNGVWKSKEELDDQTEWVKEHLALIDHAIKSSGLSVYIV